MKLQDIVRHQPGCTPLSPCAACEIVSLLRLRLTVPEMERIAYLIKASTRGKKSRDMHVMSMNIPYAVRRRLVASGIPTLEVLLMKSPSDLLCIVNFGKGALAKVQEALRLMNLKLKPNNPSM